MTTKATAARLISGVILIGTFFVWLAARSTVLDTTVGGVTDLVALVLHGTAWAVLLAGVALFASVATARSNSQ
ncbi:hypothetical protein [Microbacterium gubbeenense]|uniref:hypothetical protein n=1 Tax=Microbacteriaceae TaxID=85023 RepID=UPI003F9E1F1A